jgi:hypothetical protein
MRGRVGASTGPFDDGAMLRQVSYQPRRAGGVQIVSLKGPRSRFSASFSASGDLKRTKHDVVVAGFRPAFSHCSALDSCAKKSAVSTAVGDDNEITA